MNLGNQRRSKIPNLKPIFSLLDPADRTFAASLRLNHRNRIFTLVLAAPLSGTRCRAQMRWHPVDLTLVEAISHGGVSCFRPPAPAAVLLAPARPEPLHSPQPYFCSTAPQAYFHPNRGAARSSRADAVKVDRQEKDWWLNLGSVFPHGDGEGFNILLEALPLD